MFVGWDYDMHEFFCVFINKKNVGRQSNFIPKIDQNLPLLTWRVRSSPFRAPWAGASLGRSDEEEEEEEEEEELLRSSFRLKRPSMIPKRALGAAMVTNLKRE